MQYGEGLIGGFAGGEQTEATRGDASDWALADKSDDSCNELDLFQVGAFIA